MPMPVTMPVAASALAAEEPVAGRRRWRVVFYSHDTMGLGHRRRNLLLAHALAHSPLRASSLLVVGSAAAAPFPLPAGADSLALPSLHKELDGRYVSKNLDLSLEALIQLRKKTIRSAVEAFAPDVFVVDNVPWGAQRELEPTLEYLRARGRTHCILGLRDVLDEPEVIREEWRRAQNEEAVRDFYQSVWVYSDPAVCDPVRESGLPREVAEKARYTGYLDQRRWLEFAPAVEGELPLQRLRAVDERLVLCLLGGGQDGARLGEAFAAAELPSRTRAMLITGPLMSEDLRTRLKERAQANSKMSVVSFVREPTFLVGMADRIISMGGYNTVGEILAFEKDALIVPRVRPRSEQLIRARRLSQLGLVDMLHPDDLSPESISRWLEDDGVTHERARQKVDLSGLTRTPGLLSRIAGPAPS